MTFIDEPKGFQLRKDHYKNFIGKLTLPVAHEGGRVPHIAVHQFEPKEKNDFWTLITNGMSDVRQCAPADTPEFIGKRTELMMLVDDPDEWMFRFLMGLAHFAFDQQVFIHPWLILPMENPLVKGSLLTHLFFLPVPPLFNDGFEEFYINDELVEFLWVFPITKSESDYANKYGINAFIEKCRSQEFVLDVGRNSIV